MPTSGTNMTDSCFRFCLTKLSNKNIILKSNSINMQRLAKLSLSLDVFSLENPHNSPSVNAGTQHS